MIARSCIHLVTDSEYVLLESDHTENKSSITYISWSFRDIDIYLIIYFLIRVIYDKYDDDDIIIWENILRIFIYIYKTRESRSLLVRYIFFTQYINTCQKDMKKDIQRFLDRFFIHSL